MWLYKNYAKIIVIIIETRWMSFIGKIIIKILIVMYLFTLLIGEYETFAATELTFTETSNNNWGSGFCYGFTAENTWTDDITNWVIGLNIDGWVNNGWWATFSNIWGWDYELTSSSAQTDALAVWDTVNIGFCWNSPWNITNIHLKDYTPISGITLQDYSIATNVLQVDVTTQSSWWWWYCRNVLLTNISNDVINDWQVNFELDQGLSSSSSANYSQNWVYYTVTPLAWNQVLQIWWNASFSFCTSWVNVDNSWSIGTLSVWNNAWDVTPPTITSVSPEFDQVLPNGTFDFTFEYQDDVSGTGVDISSDIINLYEWDGFNWWPDISSSYIDVQTKQITTTGALYNANNMIWWRYKVNFSISDLDTNLSSTWIVFYVATGSIDSISPNISIDSHSNETLYPNTDFDLELSYSDNQSWVDVSTLSIELQKWNGSSYSSDISNTFIDFTWAVINNDSALFNVNKLWYWKYKILYWIDDNDWNTQDNELIFYIDEPSFSINKSELNLWNISPWVNYFGNDAFIITVETVGAWFDLYLNKESWFLYDNIQITDWNWSQGFWYDVSPYSNDISLIQQNQIIGSENTSINGDGNKNLYVYYVKFGTHISDLQAAWIYTGFISFGTAFHYE